MSLSGRVSMPAARRRASLSILHLSILRIAIRIKVVVIADRRRRSVQ